VSKLIANRWFKISVGAIIGSVAGYFYWSEIGCLTGSCAITSVWWRSTLYGALMGGLLLDLVPSQKQNKAS